MRNAPERQVGHNSAAKKSIQKVRKPRLHNSESHQISNATKRAEPKVQVEASAQESTKTFTYSQETKDNISKSEANHIQVTQIICLEQSTIKHQEKINSPLLERLPKDLRKMIKTSPRKYTSHCHDSM